MLIAVIFVVIVLLSRYFARDGMQIASRIGSVCCLDLLYQYGGSISTRGPRGDTLVHLASHNGHVAALKWLLAAGSLRELFSQSIFSAQQHSLQNLYHHLSS